MGDQGPRPGGPQALYGPDGGVEADPPHSGGPQMSGARRVWMDNLRWGVILLVVLFHTVCMFNSCGMPLGVGAPGIPAFDLVGYFCYPWFMALMFLLAGMSARFELETHTVRQFLRRRSRRLLLPLVASLLLLGPALCAVTWSYSGVTPGEIINAITPVGFAVTTLLTGMGPQWFLLALWLYTLLLLPLRKLDGKRRCAGAGWPALFLLAPVLYLSSLALPGPDRYVLYFAAFLLGYFVFAHEEVLERVQKGRLPMLAAALALFVVILLRDWGVSFTDPGYLTDPLTVLFAWCAILAALGCARAWWDRSGAAARFFNERGFSLYLFHYLPTVWGAFFLTRSFALPAILNYSLVLALATGVPLLLHELLKRLPILGTAFGIRKGPTSPTPASRRG
ncbi:MAG: hypothetical protein EOM52_10755 [Clostridia bacterium]|nr:hypothetical protein [Clostridia bacterium]